MRYTVTIWVYFLRLNPKPR